MLATYRIASSQKSKFAYLNFNKKYEFATCMVNITVESLEVDGTIFYKFKLPKVQINFTSCNLDL